MDDYSWPTEGERLAERASQSWAKVVVALPVGMRITGEVIGRQPFGVFLRIDGAPGAVGLAEITSMPRSAELPALGTSVRGHVTGHADHNHQVRVRLIDL